MIEKTNIENGLKRRLGLYPLNNIVIASMIGTGIFMTSGILMNYLRNPFLMIVLWIIGGIIALSGALCYAELGVAIPRAGAEYAFLSELFHPVLGFLSGWVLFFVGFSAPIAAIALGFSHYLMRIFPGLNTPVLLGGKLIAILVILVFMAIHVLKIEFRTGVQNVLTLLPVAFIVCLILVGFTAGEGSWGHFSQGEGFQWNSNGLKAICFSLMMIMFSFTGWNATTYIGSEVRDPKKNIPRSLLIGTGIVVLLYMGLNLLYIYAVPPKEMAASFSIGELAIGSLFEGSLEDYFAIALPVFISLALLASLSASIILGSRVYYSMARDRLFFKFASQISPKSESPSRSIIFQCIIASVLVLFGTFEQIFVYMGFSLGIFQILSVIGVFILRSQNRSSFKMPGYPIFPVIYILFGSAIICVSILQQPIEALIAVLTIGVGIPVYIYFKNFAHINFFSMQGRLNRAGYIWNVGAISVVLSIISYMFVPTRESGEIMNIVAVLFYLIIVIGGTIIIAFQVVKRLHDIEKPGSHYWLLFIPIYGYFLAFILLFKKGTPGDNMYGPDPLARAS